MNFFHDSCTLVISHNSSLILPVIHSCTFLLSASCEIFKFFRLLALFFHYQSVRKFVMEFLLNSTRSNWYCCVVRLFAAAHSRVGEVFVDSKAQLLWKNLYFLWWHGTSHGQVLTAQSTLSSPSFTTFLRDVVSQSTSKWFGFVHFLFPVFPRELLWKHNWQITPFFRWSGRRKNAVLGLKFSDLLSKQYIFLKKVYFYNTYKFGWPVNDRVNGRIQLHLLFFVCDEGSQKNREKEWLELKTYLS